MAQCPGCGTQVTAKFCPNCGTQVPQAPPSAAGFMQPPQQTQQPARPAPPPGYPPQGQQLPYGAQTPPPQYQPQYGQPPYQQPAPKSNSALKIILIVAGVLVGLLVLLVVGAAVLLPDDVVTNTQPQAPVVENTQPANPPAKPAGTFYVGAPVITDEVNPQTQAPKRILTTVPPTTDQIFAAVDIQVKKGQVLGAKWYYNGNLQEHLNTDLPIPNDYKGWASFDISNGGKAWPAGQYRVEIYLDGVKQQYINFNVK